VVVSQFAGASVVIPGGFVVSFLESGVGLRHLLLVGGALGVIDLCEREAAEQQKVGQSGWAESEHETTLQLNAELESRSTARTGRGTVCFR
jgi:hypothetical protein